MDELFIWAPKDYEESILRPWFRFANHFVLIVCVHILGEVGYVE